MGNEQSSSKHRRSSSKKKKEPETAADMARKTLDDMQRSIQSSMRQLEESSLLDSVCGTFMDEEKLRANRSVSYNYSEEVSEDDTQMSEDETLDEYDRRRKSSKKVATSESESILSEIDETQSDEVKKKKGKKSRKEEVSEDSESFISEQSSFSAHKKTAAGKGVVTETTPDVGLSMPLASSFAKRCYFTKAGIGKTTQHYEGLTLTGNVVLMLAAAMKLKGCPTICDEDLRRVEQTYPNQFSRLPDELLLSSGWRRISKYCHFSNKPIPDGVPFFHSKQRLHPSGGYYFLLAAAVGMVRPIEVEPLTRDTLVLLETDFPTQCDAAPDVLVEDPMQWTLVNKFCFFSGGPINTEEDVYYQADFDGNLIFMLAFLSPSLTPEELYKLGPAYKDEPGLKSIAAVEEVESVYDLTERDFDDLKLYHLGPCRALPPFILMPQAWTKVLPPHFLAAKQEALMIAHQYEQAHGLASPGADSSAAAVTSPDMMLSPPEGSREAFNFEPGVEAAPEHRYFKSKWAPPDGESYDDSNAPPSHGAYYSPPDEGASPQQYHSVHQGTSHASPDAYTYGSTTMSEQGQSYNDDNFQREMEEEGAFVDSNLPDDEAIASRQMNRAPMHSSRGHGGLPISPPGYRANSDPGLDPPDDEPPSLSKQLDAPDDEGGYQGGAYMEGSSPASGSGYGEHSQAEYYEDETVPYDSRAGEMQNVGGPQNGYFHDGEYYQSHKAPGGSPQYYQREDEYYDSPEGQRAGLRVHTEPQRAKFAQSPEQSSDFVYSPGESEFEEGSGFRRQEGGYYESPRGNQRPNGRVYARDEGEYYDSPDKKRLTGDTDVSTPERETYDSNTYDSNTYDDEGPAFDEESESFVQQSNTPTNRLKDRSPKSDISFTDTVHSEYSQTSAMRGAQELLKKNRQKRLEMAMRKHKNVDSEDEIMSPQGRKHENDDASASTSMVSGSSVWTDASGAGDRSSRRALILQMAKARMKSNKAGHVEEKAPDTIAEEHSHSGEGPDGSRAEGTMASDIDLVVELD